MKRHQGYQGIPAEDRGAAAAIGNFDGVHIGHQSVIGLARDVAARLGAPLGMVTFEPHPRRFFMPDAAPFRLMTADARAHRVQKLGVVQLYELPFGADLAALSPEDFVRTVLVRGLGLRHLVAGDDFRFGRGRSGDVELIRKMAPETGLDITVAPLVCDEAGNFSSTAIRRALAEGRPEDAARMLGHWHRIEGAVEHGDKRGRDLGFPTINVSLDDLHRPRYGVYAVTVDVLDGPLQGTYPGCASIGERPTFGVNRPNLEVHLLDFTGDLYGAEVSVALMEFLRPELRFDTVEALVDQMREDVRATRLKLAAAGTR